MPLPEELKEQIWSLLTDRRAYKDAIDSIENELPDDENREVMSAFIEDEDDLLSLAKLQELKQRFVTGECGEGRQTCRFTPLFDMIALKIISAKVIGEVLSSKIAEIEATASSNDPKQHT